MAKRTLVYKRTHQGDPNADGVFGCHNCMGRVRCWDFEAVIGVGGQGQKAVKSGIARKLTWIGIRPHKQLVSGSDFPLVTFDKFVHFGDHGPMLQSCAPHLAMLMYVKRARTAMTFDDNQQADVDKILAMATGAGPSVAFVAEETASERICKPKQRRSSVD